MAARIGNYEIEERLATGGMSEIYRARHLHLERPVALKVLHAHYAAAPQFRERFLQEARALAALVHPNIVGIYDFGEDDGKLYLVMELVTGGTVRALMRGQPEGRPLPWSLAVSLARQVAAGLEHAHAAGFVHRDIKPDNLLLQYESDQPATVVPPVVKIVDFGVVRLSDPLVTTDHGSTLGTPGYMSPEQCQGLDLDARSDIYSLGIVLFEMVTGRMPFEADNAAAVLYKQVHDPPPAPRQFTPRLPPRLEEIILRCLAKQPDDRFPNAASVAEALDGLLAESQQETLGMPAATGDEDSPVATPPSLPTKVAPVSPPAGADTGTSELSLMIDPVEAAGRFGGRATLRITNHGEQPATVRLAGQSDHDRLRLRLNPDVVVAVPGGETSSRLAFGIRPRLNSDPESIPFTVTASAAGRDSAEVGGVFVHQPLVSNWRPVAVGAATLWLLFCVVGAFMLSRAFDFGVFGAADADDSLGILVTDASGRVLVVDTDTGDVEPWSKDAAGLESPAGLIADASGNVYVVDERGDKVVKFGSEGEVLLVWGEPGSGPGQFDKPVDVGIGPTGNIYIVDGGNHRVQLFDPEGAYLDEWGGQGSEPGQFDDPTAIAFDEVGNFYVVDSGNRRVQKFTSFGQLIDSWGERGDEPGQFTEPFGVAVDADGNVYVTDGGSHRIQKFDFNGAFLGAWGEPGSEESQLNQPRGLIAGPENRLYVADHGNDRIQVFDIEGTHLITLAAPSTGDEKLLDKPWGVEVP